MMAIREDCYSGLYHLWRRDEEERKNLDGFLVDWFKSSV